MSWLIVGSFFVRGNLCCSAEKLKADGQYHKQLFFSIKSVVDMSVILPCILWMMQRFFCCPLQLFIIRSTDCLHCETSLS